MSGEVPERAAETSEFDDAGRPVSDAELIADARDGDATSYGLLFERHALAARRLAGHMLADSAEAENVVSEAFVRTLATITNGDGPSEAFRLHLLAMVRRVGRDVLNGWQTRGPGVSLPAGDGDSGEPVIDEFGHSLLNQAFWSLPERWTAVLWHTEIEESDPAEVALIFGLSAHAAAALSYRAREGLRQAYLQLYVESVHPECRPVARKLAAHVRAALSVREAAFVDRHRRDCPSCARAYSELAQVNVALRAAVAPLVMGGAAVPYLSDIIAPESLSDRFLSSLRGLRSVTRHFEMAQRAIVAVGGAALIVIVAVALAYVPVGNGSQSPGGAPAVAESTAGLSRSAEGHVVPSAPAARPTSRRSSRGVSPKPSPRTPTAGRSASTQPRPGPSASQSPSPQPSPATSAPGPGPSQESSPALALAVSLVQTAASREATVMFQVSDVGGGPSGGLTAMISFPAGTELVSGSQYGRGWQCLTAARGASCSHAAVHAGARARMVLTLMITSSAGNGEPVSVTVVSGPNVVSATSPQTLRS